MNTVSLSDQERNEQAAAIRRGWDMSAENEGYGLRLLGRPLTDCASPQMQKGWNQARIDAENQFAETSGLAGWLIPEIA